MLLALHAACAGGEHDFVLLFQVESTIAGFPMVSWSGHRVDVLARLRDSMRQGLSPEGRETLSRRFRQMAEELNGWTLEISPPKSPLGLPPVAPFRWYYSQSSRLIRIEPVAGELGSKVTIPAPTRPLRTSDLLVLVGRIASTTLLGFDLGDNRDREYGEFMATLGGTRRVPLQHVLVNPRNPEEWRFDRDAIGQWLRGEANDEDE